MVTALATEEGGCRRPIFHFFSQRCYSKDLDQKDAIDLPDHGGKLRIGEEISQPMKSDYDMCVTPSPVIPGCAKNVHLASLQGPGQKVVSQGRAIPRPVWAWTWTDAPLVYSLLALECNTLCIIGT